MKILFYSALILLFAQCGGTAANSKPTTMDTTKSNPYFSYTDTAKLNVSNKEWEKLLPPDVYEVAREEGTERPGSSALLHQKGKGVFCCAVCGKALFSSATKFESGTGWPSFYQPLSKAAVVDITDNSLGMSRTEVQCSRCASHLGHVFDDGPEPTGLRYCMNGVVLKFKGE